LGQSISCKDFTPGGFTNCDNSGVAELPFRRDCVETAKYVPCNPQPDDLVLIVKLLFKGCGNGNDPGTCLPKNAEKREVFKFSNHFRFDLQPSEPLVQFPAYGSVIGRKQNGCAVQRLRKPFAVKRSEEHTSELQSRFDLVCR